MKHWITVALLLLAGPAIADMYQDGSNAKLPDARTNLGLGTSSMVQFGGLGIGAVPTATLPFKLDLKNDLQGWAASFNKETVTGMTGNAGGVAGLLSTAYEKHPHIGPFTQSYVIGAGFSAGSFVNNGAVDTTLAATATPGATTLTLADATGFVDTLPVQVVCDDEYTIHTFQVGAPAGNVITISPAIPPGCIQASAGNLVYVWRSAIQGMIGTAATFAGSKGHYLEAAEFAVTAEVGSRPYMKSILSIGGNAADKVSAISPYDSGLTLTAATQSVGTKVGISFDNRSARQLVQPTGTLIKSFGGGYANGLDFSTSGFTEYSLKLPGMTVATNGRVALTGSFPEFKIRDTNGIVDAGGIWRLAAANNGLIWQMNTAPSGDMSAGPTVLTLKHGLLQINGPGPDFRMQSNNVAADAGGLWRMSVAAGAITFQSNTDATGNFATAVTSLGLSAVGDIFTGQTTALPVGSAFKHLFIPTMAGAPTGTPSNAAAGRTAIVWDSTNKKMCAYNQPTSAWACSAAFTP